MAKSDPPAKRWYKRKRDGQLGYMVTDPATGKERIRLDRPAEEIFERYTDSAWEPVSSDRPVTRQQVARVAFAADRALCLMLAMHLEGREEWISLSDKKRQEFVKDGPPADPPLRRQVYEAIMDCFPNRTG